MISVVLKIFIIMNYIVHIPPTELEETIHLRRQHALGGGGGQKFAKFANG